MRIAYITNVRLPNERAHGHQIAETVKAMVSMGHEIEVFAPYRKNTISQDFWEYYQMPGSVQLHYLGSTDYIASRFTPGAFGLFAMNRMVRRELENAHLNHYDVLYTRTPALLPYLVYTGVPVILELHRIPRWQLSRFVDAANHCKVVSCLTTLMRDELIAAGVEKDRLIVEPDGVDLDRFSELPNREQSRNDFNLRSDQFVLGYAGSLATMGKSKGVEDFLKALEVVHKEDARIHALIAGGPEETKAELQTLIPPEAATFTGHLSQEGVKSVFAASDVMLYLAPKSTDPFFMRDTSPLKVFEYMAAKKLIISADIPPIHDILEPRTAIFFEPGNIESIVAAVRRAKTETDQHPIKIARAYEKVEHYTWRKRTQRILSKLSS